MRTSLPLLLLAAFCLWSAGPATAETVIQLEAENMTAWYNTAGLSIVPVSCGAARGGWRWTAWTPPASTSSGPSR